MRTGILCKTPTRWNEQHFPMLRSFGFDGADINFAETETFIYGGDLSEQLALLRAAAQRAADAGICISQVHGPWRCPPADATEEDRAERLDKMIKSMHMAVALGCRNWVIHPIMPYGMWDTRDGTEAQTRRANMEFFGPVVDNARRLGLTVCLENLPMPDFSLSPPAAVHGFIREFNDPHLAACLDTGHANIFRDLSAGDAARLLGPSLRVLHVHDNDGTRDAHLLPGEGTVDWADFTAALAEIGFSGVFSLECAPSQRLPSPEYEQAFRRYADRARELVGEL